MPLAAGRRSAAGRNTKLEPPPAVFFFGLVPDLSSVWTTLGLGLLSIVLATIERGWQKLSHSKLIESEVGPDARARLEKVLKRSEEVESSLMVARVAVLVALVMSLLGFIQTRLGSPSTPEAVLWTGPIAFLWITIFCRILPDELSPDRLQAIVKATIPAAKTLGAILGPPTALLRSLMQRLTGHTAEEEAEALADEILATVEEGEREGHLDPDQVTMIERILEMQDVEVHRLMTPRTDLNVIDVTSTVAEARNTATKTGRSRYPLVEENDVDKIMGVIHVKDLLTGKDDVPLQTLARKPWFVPESKFCTELLAEFREQRTHLAIVLDEYGGTAGIVTIEDVLEEIVGEIDDEFDKAKDTAELQVIDNHHAVALGTIHLDELNDSLGVSLPESDDWTTLGGYIFNTLGRLPEKGEELVHENVHLIVDSVVNRRVDRVRVKIRQPAA
ncbi:MAG: hemolysin family protein [Planctomycetota bacterium]|nr:hemolysin family protein [Planctomycetota bacterium]